MTKLALIGDHSDDVIAHRAIPKAIQLAADSLAIDCQADWIHTNEIDLTTLKSYQGIWCVPASPYANTGNAIAAIQLAREEPIPFFGTCGGYQHAVLEYAQNVLGHLDADSIENNPNTGMPLVNALFCELREKPAEIFIKKPSRVFSIVGKDTIAEQYNCGFGVNAEYLSLFENTDLRFSGFDKEHDPRIIELDNHPFFIGTAFQPERSALADQTHPLIIEFVKASNSALS